MSNAVLALMLLYILASTVTMVYFYRAYKKLKNEHYLSRLRLSEIDNENKKFKQNADIMTALTKRSALQGTDVQSVILTVLNTPLFHEQDATSLAIDVFHKQQSTINNCVATGEIRLLSN